MSSFTPTGGSGGLPLSTTTAGATNPQVSNISVVLANTEQTLTLPSGTRRFALKFQSGDAVLTIATISGGPVLTVPRWCYYSEGELLLTSPKNIFIQSNQAAQIVELIVWT